MPIGIRLISSTPQATATSTTSLPTSDVARLVACWLDPHCVSMRGRRGREREAGRQPRRAGDVEALLADLADAAADDLADLGRVDAGAFDERRLHVPSRSAGCMLDRPPPRRPIGVRTASTITTFELDMRPSLRRR